MKMYNAVLLAGSADAGCEPGEELRRLRLMVRMYSIACRERNQPGWFMVEYGILGVGSLSGNVYDAITWMA